MRLLTCFVRIATEIIGIVLILYLVVRSVCLRIETSVTVANTDQEERIL